MQRKAVNPFNAVVPPPLVAEPVRPAHHEPVKYREENGAIPTEAEESPLKHLAAYLRESELFPQSLENQGRCDLLGLDAGLAFARKDEQHCLGMAGKRPHQSFDIPLLVQGIQAADAVDHSLHEFTRDFSALNDLQVLMVTRFYYAADAGQR